MHQDKLGDQKLGMNGRSLSSKRTRYMNIRYFFIGDVQKRQHIRIKFCLTDEMICDFSKRSVGGAKFRHFRNIIMHISLNRYGPLDVEKLMAMHNDHMVNSYQPERSVGQNPKKTNKTP